jgi:hypothetical protein
MKAFSLLQALGAVLVGSLTGLALAIAAVLLVPFVIIPFRLIRSGSRWIISHRPFAARHLSLKLNIPMTNDAQQMTNNGTSK